MVWADYPPRAGSPETEEWESVSAYSTDISLMTDRENHNSPSSVKLSWRLNPIESYSDWTIEIRVRNSNGGYGVEIYNVHRPILAFGPRKSGFFANLFDCGVTDHATLIDLSEKGAAFFPDFLDYLYYSETFQIRTRNAVGLGFLAQCFMVPPLQKEVEDFIRQDLQFCNVGTYMTEAIHFKDEGTSTRVVDKCVEEMMRLCAGSVTVRDRVFPLAASTADSKYHSVWQFLTKFPNVVVARVKHKSPRKKGHNL
jgi:hypothetical protein